MGVAGPRGVLPTGAGVRAFTTSPVSARGRSVPLSAWWEVRRCFLPASRVCRPPPRLWDLLPLVWAASLLQGQSGPCVPNSFLWVLVLLVGPSRGPVSVCRWSHMSHPLSPVLWWQCPQWAFHTVLPSPSSCAGPTVPGHVATGGLGPAPGQFRACREATARRCTGSS